MPWFRIDDTFADHPKVTNAGNAAVGLWVRCGTYASRFLTDGQVPDAVARGYGSRKDIERLVLARLWVPTDDGYAMPDFLDYNPSAEQVKLSSQTRGGEEEPAASAPPGARRSTGPTTDGSCPRGTGRDVPGGSPGESPLPVPNP